MTNDEGKIEYGYDFWYKDVKDLLGPRMPEREEYISIYGRLLVNSFALRADNNGEEENIGTALYRANSIFDHSCWPNATTVFSGNSQKESIHLNKFIPGKRLYIKSLVSSPNMKLSDFFISYLDQSMPRAARRAKLKYDTNYILIPFTF